MPSVDVFCFLPAIHTLFGKKRDKPLQSQGIGLPLYIFIISSVLFESDKIIGVSLVGQRRLQTL